MKHLLTVHNLEKSYGGRKVVDGLSFEVGEGEIVGLLGPNGAGKTTAFYMTMGFIRPDKGESFLMMPTSQKNRSTNGQEWGWDTSRKSPQSSAI